MSNNLTRDNEGNKLWILGVALGVLAFAVIVLVGVVYYVRKTRYRTSRSMQTPIRKVSTQCLKKSSFRSMKVECREGWWIKNCYD